MNRAMIGIGLLSFVRDDMQRITETLPIGREFDRLTAAVGALADPDPTGARIGSRDIG